MDVLEPSIMLAWQHLQPTRLQLQPSIRPAARVGFMQPANAVHGGEVLFDFELDGRGVPTGEWSRHDVRLPSEIKRVIEEVVSSNIEVPTDAHAFAKTVVRTENAKAPWWRRMFRRSSAGQSKMEHRNDGFIDFLIR